MSDLAYLSATELSKMIQSRTLSPVELTEHFINRIEKMDPLLRTYISPLPDVARQQAKKAESDIMRGHYKSPLHGIPIGIKDNFYTKDLRTTVGSKLFADFIPSQNATTVNKLSKAGTIILGKQNMHELAAGSTGTNPFYGDTKNPWHTKYMPGGSSGGGTAALAAGLTTLAIGTDTFGSIRLPAAMCGVYGLKPTYGLVSTYGVFPTAWSLDTAGPMARSVCDLAVMLNKMAGFDINDPASLNIALPDYTKKINKEIKGLKIGVPSYFLEGLDKDVEELFQQAITTFKTLGANLFEIEIPELSMSTFAGYVITSGEAATLHFNWLKHYPEDYSEDIRSYFLTGTLTNTTQYVSAQQVRRKMIDAFKQAFQDVDLMLAPTIPMTTPAYQENWIEQNLAVVKRCMPFTVPINLTGVPSLAVPMGLDKRGLPVGMQLIGNHLSEQLLLQVGSVWENTHPLTNTLEKK